MLRAGPYNLGHKTFAGVVLRYRVAQMARLEDPADDIRERANANHLLPTLLKSNQTQGTALLLLGDKAFKTSLPGRYRVIALRALGFPALQMTRVLGVIGTEQQRVPCRLAPPFAFFLSQ